MLHKDQLKEDGIFTEVRFYDCVSKITRLQIANGTIIRTIRVWLYHMRIRVWYVPYAYGINTRMVQNSYM